MLPVLFILICGLVSVVSGDVNTGWMGDILRQHFSQPRHHFTGTQYKEDVRTFIRQEFSSYGLEVQIQTFASAITNITGQNIIGVLKGRNYGTLHDAVSGIAAHYDTMPNTQGVDDNGSGIVAMLQTAKILKSHGKRENTILFIAFDLEEWEKGVTACVHGDCGSEAFVEEWIPSFFNKSYGVYDYASLGQLFRGIIILDTLMNFNDSKYSQSVARGMEQSFPASYSQIVANKWRGNFLFHVSRSDDQLLAHAFISAWSRFNNHTYLLNSVQLPVTGPLSRIPSYIIRRMSPFLRSNHKSFWQRGYHAIFLTDTGNYRGLMESCYHSACDDISFITEENLSFLSKTTQAMVDTIGSFSPLTGAGPTTTTDELPVG